MTSFISGFVSNESGGATIGFGLIAASVAIAITWGGYTIGTGVTESYEIVSGAMESHQDRYDAIEEVLHFH